MNGARIMEIPKCRECEEHGRSSRSDDKFYYFCWHPMGGEYIPKDIKTSPKWCPKRAKGDSKE